MTDDDSISSSGKQALIVGRSDQTVRLIDVASGRELYSTTASGDKLHFLEFPASRALSAEAYSSDGEKLVTVGGAEAVVWSRKTARKQMSFSPHGPVVYADVPRPPTGKTAARCHYESSAGDGVVGIGHEGWPSRP